MATDVTAGDRDMRENDGRKLDHRTLEALRLRAIDQVHQGARPEDVAVALGLHRKTVYAWLKKYREGPVYLVVDRHPAHRAQCVKDYAAASHGKLELFYLPTGYVGLLMKGRGRESPALG
jgi:predicted DNA-binding protein (UPF0251 family)